MKFFINSIVFDDGVRVRGRWSVDDFNNFYFQSEKKHLYLEKYFDDVKNKNNCFSVRFVPEDPYYNLIYKSLT